MFKRTSTQFDELDLENNNEILEEIFNICDKCGNDRAYFEIRQLRAFDEPATQILKCTKCKNIERRD